VFTIKKDEVQCDCTTQCSLQENETQRLWSENILPLENTFVDGDYKYEQYIVKHNSINDFIKVYSLHCFAQRHVSVLVMNHLQVDYFFLHPCTGTEALYRPYGL